MGEDGHPSKASIACTRSSRASADRVSSGCGPAGAACCDEGVTHSCTGRFRQLAGRLPGHKCGAHLCCRAKAAGGQAVQPARLQLPELAVQLRAHGCEVVRRLSKPSMLRLQPAALRSPGVGHGRRACTGSPRLTRCRASARAASCSASCSRAWCWAISRWCAARVSRACNQLRVSQP